MAYQWCTYTSESVEVIYVEIEDEEKVLYWCVVRRVWVERGKSSGRIQSCEQLFSLGTSSTGAAKGSSSQVGVDRVQFHPPLLLSLPPRAPFPPPFHLKAGSAVRPPRLDPLRRHPDAVRHHASVPPSSPGTSTHPGSRRSSIHQHPLLQVLLPMQCPLLLKRTELRAD